MIKPLSYRPKQAAEALGISERMLWSLTQSGVLPHVKTGRVTLYPVAMLRSWLEAQAINPPMRKTIGAVEQATTRVIHWRDREQYPEWVYIGRNIPRQRITGSPFANPFKIGQDGSRADVLAKYSQWLASQPELIQQARALKGKVLVCWCAPEDCHGHILAKIAEGGAA